MDTPYFVATSTSARQLFLLLRCIAFGDKVQMQITPDGLSFSVEESSVMEAMVFLNKNLFSSFALVPPSDESASQLTPFSLSLTALLEALQMFGISELTKSTNPFWPNTPDAFSTHTLGLAGLCRISYDSPGSPLSIILEEARITTKCELMTYEPSTLAEIPFARDELSLKAILGASYLHDVIVEMSTSSSDQLIITADEQGLSLSSPNHHGAISFQFSRNDSTILETFKVADDSFQQSYKFSHIASTKRALSSATKVSMRADNQGVLSLQFMIENIDGAAGVSFVDFVFIPLISMVDNDDDPVDG
jgi:cell cycle checkpoint protein